MKKVIFEAFSINQYKQNIKRELERLINKENPHYSYYYIFLLFSPKNSDYNVDVLIDDILKFIKENAENNKDLYIFYIKLFYKVLSNIKTNEDNYKLTRFIILLTRSRIINSYLKQYKLDPMKTISFILFRKYDTPDNDFIPNVYKDYFERTFPIPDTNSIINDIFDILFQKKEQYKLIKKVDNFEYYELKSYKDCLTLARETTLCISSKETFSHAENYLRDSLTRTIILVLERSKKNTKPKKYAITIFNPFLKRSIVAEIKDEKNQFVTRNLEEKMLNDILDYIIEKGVDTIDDSIKYELKVIKEYILNLKLFVSGDLIESIIAERCFRFAQKIEKIMYNHYNFFEKIVFKVFENTKFYDLLMKEKTRKELLTRVVINNKITLFEVVKKIVILSLINKKDYFDEISLLIERFRENGFVEVVIDKILNKIQINKLEEEKYDSNSN